jgi:hypothetical protein
LGDLYFETWKKALKYGIKREIFGELYFETWKKKLGNMTSKRNIWGTFILRPGKKL